ncbi:MAG: 50S ribosomal protein L17 [Bacteroidota bacterium]
MRHQVKGRKLNRTAAHRRATFRALAKALILEHRITTTVEKAKELRRFVEPLITRAKSDTNHNRRIVFAALQDKEAVKQIFAEVGPSADGRPGGYTRVIKAGFRQGDGAELAIIELVDFNDIKPEGKTAKKKRSRRSKKATPKAEAAATEAPVEETTETAEVIEEVTTEAAVVDETEVAEESITETQAEATAEETITSEEDEEEKPSDK